jgi:predicted TPR repeat methyltransferase
MLDVAAKRDCYTALVQGCCPDVSAAATRDYDVIFCAGTFTPNHAPATTLPELVGLARTGGHVAFSVRTYHYEDDASGFRTIQSDLETAGKWRKVAEEERDYLPAEDVKALYFVYQKL